MYVEVQLKTHMGCTARVDEQISQEIYSLEENATALTPNVIIT